MALLLCLWSSFCLQGKAAPKPELVEYDFTLGFAGDINFDDSWCNMAYFHRMGDDLEAVIDPAYLQLMRDVDLMWINNEFAYSDGGTPLAGKAYTFRADPENVRLLKEMGVDIVGLANNHVYDYGKEALLDTLDTLKKAGIPCGGAGRNLEEASAPVYLEADGQTVAFVHASRAEIIKMTPQATDTEPGILRCYDDTLFLEKIREARQKADVVIALVHWGTEYSTTLEEAQIRTGHACIDAGADAVIGAHSHCLQGMEYYRGKPIVYSLGNYWFNEKTLDTMMVSLRFYGYNHSRYQRLQIYPGVQKDFVTTLAKEEEEQRRIYDHLEEISGHIYINPKGIVYPGSH